MPSKAEFESEITAQIARARRQGRPHVEINAGEIHRILGGYPPAQGHSHAMPNCCAAMRDVMRGGDQIVFETESGQSASLTIRYITKV